MNDLIIPSELEKAFPSMAEGLKKASKLFQEVNSFEDVERLFLKGAGLSPNTYRSYLIAVKQFYEWSGGLNPLQVRAGDIESFFDYMTGRVERKTAVLRITGLKKFFSSINRVVPFYTSPFDTMDEKLKKKLSKTRKGNRKKAALTHEETLNLLEWLREKEEEKLTGNYAIVFMLVSSGLRASELIQLKWGNIELVDGTYTAYFTGKGDTDAEQELYTPAVTAAYNYFKQFHGRDPQSNDHLFWTRPRYNGDVSRPLPYHTLWQRIKDISTQVQEEGIIKRNIKITAHTFRRTYATQLYKQGMGIKAIQMKTRHKSLSVLTEHYIKDEEPALSYLNSIFETPKSDSPQNIISNVN